MAANLNGAVLLDSIEGNMEILNSTQYTNEEIFERMPANGAVFSALKSWADNFTGMPNNGPGLIGQPGIGRTGGLMDRDRYVMPSSYFDKLRLAYHAARYDDNVSNVLETTEALAFSKVSFYAEDEGDQDVYNQIADEMDLDQRLREMWRELFITSQFYCGIWWDKKEFKVHGLTDTGKKSKKKITVRYPREITMLDPLKIVPVGNFLFGQEKLVYLAERGEEQYFIDALNSRGQPGGDPIIERLIMAPYTATQADQPVLDQFGVGRSNGLFLLNPQNVFRHTLTRPSFQPVADVRMASIFELLDLKQQLRQMDRAHLIGGTNFIVVITQGSDKLPAQPQEINHLQASVRTLARTPVLIGDHRLSVEIVTPKLDTTMKPERYNTVDSRITARLFQMFMLGNYAAGAGNDDSVKLVKVIARGIESRRQQMVRTLHKQVFKPLFETNDALTTEPALQFHPRSIALDFDPTYATFLMDLKANGHISRETLLNAIDLDEADEARLVQREADHYDDIFNSHVPFDSPANTAGGPAAPAAVSPVTTPADKRSAGRQQGGNRNGGGAAPGTGQGKPAANPRKKAN